MTPPLVENEVRRQKPPGARSQRDRVALSRIRGLVSEVEAIDGVMHVDADGLGGSSTM